MEKDIDGHNDKGDFYYEAVHLSVVNYLIITHLDLYLTIICIWT